MTFSRKKQLLAIFAARAIPEHRRKELLAELAEWSERSSIRDAQELFWVLEAGASQNMEQCLKQVQAEERRKVPGKKAAA